ncbi:putative transglutaminase elicitor [Plasmopara halstedii]
MYNQIEPYAVTLLQVPQPICYSSLYIWYLKVLPIKNDRDGRLLPATHFFYSFVNPLSLERITRLPPLLTDLQSIQQTSGASLYYTTYTTSETVNELCGNFPGAGSEVPDEHTTFEVKSDPTLPDVTTIPTAPVTNPEFLTNTTFAPIKSVFEIVGTSIVSEDIPNDNDAYAYVSSPLISTPLTETKPKDCATGWEASTFEQKESDDSTDKHNRRLISNSNLDIEKVEAFFGVKMETKLKKLPTESAHTTAPWAAPYWPTYQDSINVVWSPGNPSASAKYAMAFGKNVTKFMDNISAKYGIDSRINARQCSESAQCAGTDIASNCSKREGESTGRCVPTWFGICHAWAGAAISEPEPECPVTHNGVTFQPLDLKGLVSVIYDDTKVGTVFTGARFRTGTTERDAYGRSKDPALRDMNPGFFHIVATNILGKLKSSFIVDVSAGREVWNQPVRGFKVFEQTAMSLKEAAQTFYGLEKYPWNEAAKSIVYVKTRLSWIVESYEDGPLVSSKKIDQYTNGMYYYYLLELNKKGLIVGGEWVYNSDVDHPDFMWLIRTKPAPDAVTSTGISYSEVSMLLKKAVKCSKSPSSSTGGNQNTTFPATEALGNVNPAIPLVNNTVDPNNQDRNNSSGNNPNVQGSNSQGGQIRTDSTNTSSSQTP